MVFAPVLGWVLRELIGVSADARWVLGTFSVCVPSPRQSKASSGFLRASHACDSASAPAHPS